MTNKKRVKALRSAGRQIVTGAAWYRSEQWTRLLEAASDRQALEPTYAEWQSNAQKAIADLTRQGIEIRKVDIDLDELLAWCRGKKCSVDAEARAAFTAEKLQQHDRKRRGKGDA
jgi:diphthamide synthase (EF-2-diphthine--ammonia ligase)